MDLLHKQIQEKCVSIGFRVKGLTIRIHGKPGEDQDRPDWWKVFAVLEEDGKPKRTMSRVMSPTEVTKELESSVTTARAMLSHRVPS